MKNKKSGIVVPLAPTRGFTLIELLVTLSVAAILLGVAVPGLQMFIANNRLSSQANDLISDLNLARSEAVKRAANVRVCASSDGSTCTGDWVQGWVVLDAAGTLIRVQQALADGSALSGGADVTDTITFTSSGRTTIPTSATPASTTLTLCPRSPATVQGRAIQIERTGRPHVSAVDCP